VSYFATTLLVNTRNFGDDKQKNSGGWRIAAVSGTFVEKLLYSPHYPIC
jgi:hypothetical protein